MNGDQIFEQLKNSSDRWGGNNPSLYLTTAILEEMPLEYIAGGYDRYQFIMNRELTVAEEYTLLMLKPDQFNKDGNQYNMWWD